MIKLLYVMFGGFSLRNKQTAGHVEEKTGGFAALGLVNVPNRLILGIVRSSVYILEPV